MPDRTTHLVLPGYQNSGPEHWQTRWEAAEPDTFRRVQQADWDHPDQNDWIARVDAAVAEAAADGPVVLVAHSLGCVTVARWVAAALPGGPPRCAARCWSPPRTSTPPKSRS